MGKIQGKVGKRAIVELYSSLQYVNTVPPCFSQAVTLRARSAVDRASRSARRVRTPPPCSEEAAAWASAAGVSTVRAEAATVKILLSHFEWRALRQPSGPS